MNVSAIEIKASNRNILSKVAVSVLPLLLLCQPQTALAAAAADAQFQKFITDLCQGTITPPPGVVWDTAALLTMCTNAQSGFAGAGVATVSANLGAANAGSGAGSRNKVLRQRLDEEEQKDKPKGASADGGGWGLLVAPQYGKSRRIDTDLENGFNSDLKGLALGLDYRFSDRFVLGAMLGHIQDKATFLNSGGYLKTSNNTLTAYFTWLPTGSVAIDGYLGYGKNKLDSQRNVVFGTAISGPVSGNTTGRQMMGGLSVSYNKDIGRVSFSPFINVDGIKTTFDGFNETGATLLELHFSDRKSLSTTSSVGARASTSHGYGWGSLSPSVRLAAVHEYQNNAAQINNELVLTPGAGFLVATDAPDRNYLSAGVGLAAGLNGGTQMYLNYEARVKDALLKSWAVSAGVLVEY
jgi:uncharacterized protein YhjY with autotransporter beta-barrel domain